VAQDPIERLSFPVSFRYGAPHASELQYLFGLPDAAYPKTLPAQQQQLRRS
jgi:hypothetical protein